ncbi:trypsin-like isoform X2 [Anoplolepis gracilipes]
MRLNLNSRIINGTKAASRQFPHQVSLMHTRIGHHFCGGSIISIKSVLTAAHCMYRNGTLISPREIIVVGGVLKLNENTATRQERGVTEFRIHPEFILNTLQNDVAVLQLSAPFEFTPEVYSVPLPINPIVPETLCQVSGFGIRNKYWRVSNNLMYVDLPIRSITECRELVVNETDLPAGMFCAGYLEGGRDACHADSGGGMVCNGILTGIVSFGIGCGRPKLPGVYTDIFYYLNWISENENVRMPRGFDNSRCSNGTHKMPTIIVLMISFLLVLLSVIS